MNAVVRRTGRPRGGMVLIIVLIVVAVLTLAAYTFSNLMLTHNEAERLRGRKIQARQLVDSGVDYVKYYLMQDEAAREEAGGDYDNPSYFQGVVVVDDEDPKQRGSFTVLSPSLDAEGNSAGVRYGLEDESSRLNLNALPLADQVQENGGRDLLLALPGMTEEIADAIMDWIDEDDEPRDLGAEVDYYSTLDPPYAPRNGPLQTVEELLLVRGVTPQLLFGLDVNRNGVVDDYEATGQVYGGGDVGGEMAMEVQSYGGQLDRGWSAYLTLYSMEKNVNAEGQPRVYLNQDDMQQLYDELSEVFDPDWATFIVAYRQNGPYDGNEQGEAYSGGELDLSQPGKQAIKQALDLIGAKVEVRFAGENQPTVLRSPFANDPAAMLAYLPELMDNVTVSSAATIPGRVNINQCPAAILAGIPGLEEDQVEAILDQRSAESDDGDWLANQQQETWLLAYGIVSLDEMKKLAPLVCCGGDVYRAQIVGYFEGGGASARAEVVFDATAAPPGLLLWRDISHLGRGYSLETLGVHLAEDLPAAAP